MIFNRNLCGSSESKNPYGELGNVSRGNCCCFVSVESSIGKLKWILFISHTVCHDPLTAALGPISPGCGCDSQAVNEIMNELKARQTGRGDTAQIKRAEQTLERLDEIESKLDKIIDHLQIQRS
jgi:hypothetical protein